MPPKPKLTRQQWETTVQRLDRQEASARSIAEEFQALGIQITHQAISSRYKREKNGSAPVNVDAPPPVNVDEEHIPIGVHQITLGGRQQSDVNVDNPASTGNIDTPSRSSYPSSSPRPPSHVVLPRSEVNAMCQRIDDLEKIVERQQSILAAAGMLTPSCPHCGSEQVVKNSRVGRSQRFLCRNCGSNFKVHPDENL